MKMGKWAISVRRARGTVPVSESGGRARRVLPIAALLAASLATVPLAPARAGDPGVRTQTFNYNGTTQSFVVPPRVKAVAFNALGAAGGGFIASSGAGLGGRVSGLMLVNPGETLTVTAGGVGGNGTTGGAGGAGGFNGGAPGGAGCASPCRLVLTGNRTGGGGGGGATTIRRSGVVMIAAGGGGGRGGDLIDAPGGSGGGLVGMPGSPGTPCDSNDVEPAPLPDTSSSVGGMGGNAAVGVTGGGAGGKGARGGSTGGFGGVLLGGAGGSAESGGTGGGGGGGGGYFGGGGGGGGGYYSTLEYHYLCGGAGGGGGSSWAIPSALAAGPAVEPGVNPLAGVATLTWVDDGGPTPVGVVVSPVTPRNAGESVSVTAKVVDQDGNPMAGRVVTFERNGTNPGTTTATTGSSGEATTSYTGTGGGGADVITASTPSIGGVKVSGVGTVAWAGAPSQRPPATVVFTPPVAQGPVGSSISLPFRVVGAQGVPQYVQYCVAPPTGTATLTGCTTSGTARADSDATGTPTGTVVVTPTAATPVLRVTAHLSTVGVQLPDESPVHVAGEPVRGAALAVGLAPPPPPTVPDVTTVVFEEPTATTNQGVPRTMRFTARKGIASFSGTVWVRTGAPGLAATATPVPVSVSGGSGSVPVTPTAATPVVQVLAYADNSTAGQVNAQDANEALGTAAVVGTSPQAPGTAVVFKPPVAVAAPGATVQVPFVAYNLDGTPYANRLVRYGVGDPQAAVSYNTSTLFTNSQGEGTIPVSASRPVTRVLAYADRSGTGSGTQDTTEAAGAAAVVAASPPPPPPTSGTAVVFLNPAPTAPPGVLVSVPFLLVRHDGQPFAGTLRWGEVTASVPSFPNSASADSDGRGTITVMARDLPTEVLGYAEGAGSPTDRDATELLGSTTVIGMS
jgi:hypothetical protein